MGPFGTPWVPFGSHFGAIWESWEAFWGYMRGLGRFLEALGGFGDHFGTIGEAWEAFWCHWRGLGGLLGSFGRRWAGVRGINEVFGFLWRLVGISSAS